MDTIKNEIKNENENVIKTKVKDKIKSKDKELMKNELLKDIEPILKENPNRFTTFPIEWNDIWDMYKKQVQCIWVPEEIDFSKDIVDWNEKLKDNERHFIKWVLAFFAASDGIVLENLVSNFCNEVSITEGKYFYGLQGFMEQVHSETYSLMIDTYIKDSKEKDKLLHAIDTIPVVTKKANWALKWIGHDEVNLTIKEKELLLNLDIPEELKNKIAYKKPSFPERLIAFAVVEGIFFSSSFCAIFWLKTKGIMQGLSMSNEFISRDEGMHMDFAVLLYSKLVNKLNNKTVQNIVREAVVIEQEFVRDALPWNLAGMNAKLMCEYVEYCADRLLKQLRVPIIYNANNPFPFMEMLSLENKTNFFESRVSNYKKSGAGNTQEENSFTLDADF